MTYAVKMSRQTAVRYIAWEFGLSRVREMLEKLEPVTPGFYRLPLAERIVTPVSVRKMRRRDAENFLRRVLTVNAYQAGRLGKPLNSGDAYVTAIAKAEG